MFWHPLFSFTSQAPVPPAPTATTSSGGFVLPLSRGKTQQERYEERRRFGIEIPKAAAKVIDRVVKAEVAAPTQDPDAALRRALERRELAYKALYAEYMQQEIQRMREDEEYALVLLMH